MWHKKVFFSIDFNGCMRKKPFVCFGWAPIQWFIKRDKEKKKYSECLKEKKGFFAWIINYMETHTKKIRIERWKRYNNGSSSTLINDKLLKFNRTSFHLPLSPRCVLLTAQTAKRKNNNKKLTNFVHCLALCKHCVYKTPWWCCCLARSRWAHKNTRVVSFSTIKKGNAIIIKQKDIDQEYIVYMCI